MLPLVVLTQLGLIVGLGILIDAIIVRTLVIPALFAVIGDRIGGPTTPAEPKPLSANMNGASFEQVNTCRDHGRRRGGGRRWKHRQRAKCPGLVCAAAHAAVPTAQRRLSRGVDQPLHRYRGDVRRHH